MRLSAEKVLVTVGTPCTMSAVGSTESYLARAAGRPDFLSFAAFDAGLVEFDPASITAAAPRLRWKLGARAGQEATPAAIDTEVGQRLRAQVGVRRTPPGVMGLQGPCDIAACLPHDLETGGLRRLAGITYKDVRSSSLKDMHSLFDDDPWRAPSLQSQLFVYAALGALAALPAPLAELVPDPFAFRIAAATAFGGMDAMARWRSQGTSKGSDKLAMRLASSLASHGPALVSTMLAPGYGLSKALKNPALLDSLRSLQSPGYLRVPQAPLTTVGACASSAIALCEVAPQMMFEYPGYHRPQLVVWTAADAALQPDFGVLDAFGPQALTNTATLAELNANRAGAQRRSIGDCLAPFDIDASGTVVGNAGSGVVITTLEFALRHFLDVTSLIVGWGQSSEAGGKGHFAGVGFGGENAIVHALDMAAAAHDYGMQDFGYLVAHATGTRTNSRTELATVAAGRAGAALRQKFKGPLPLMHVGAPKTVGDGHSMGETGLKAVGQAIQYVLGGVAPGVPTLRQVEPEIGAAAAGFILQAAPVKGNADGGALCATQGFGGYNGAVALRSANAAALHRYDCDPALLAAYLERWPQVRAEREAREALFRRGERMALTLAERHRWRGQE